MSTSIIVRKGNIRLLCKSSGRFRTKEPNSLWIEATAIAWRLAYCLLLVVSIDSLKASLTFMAIFRTRTRLTSKVSVGSSLRRSSSPLNLSKCCV